MFCCIYTKQGCLENLKKDRYLDHKNWENKKKRQDKVPSVLYLFFLKEDIWLCLLNRKMQLSKTIFIREVKLKQGKFSGKTV